MANLIIYFSLSNNTKSAAEKIHQFIKSDIVRLEPQVPYPVGYGNYVPIAQKEFENQIHPAIKTKIANLEKYDTIYLGYPTWSGQVPMIFHTLFEKYNFTGKKIIPFTTSASSPISESMTLVKELAHGSEVTDGLRYNGNDSQLKEFLNNK